jgi:hypothetical protein
MIRAKEQFVPHDGSESNRISMLFQTLKHLLIGRGTQPPHDDAADDAARWARPAA